MSVYRITEFTSSDMDKTKEFAETLREDIQAAGAEFIDIVSLGNDKGMVIARYADQATMDTASEVAKQAFGKMIAAGVVQGESINQQSGEVILSY